MAEIQRVQMSVRKASVVTVPIDDTLKISGQAADAKAVGDALAEKADKSELETRITVNGQGADDQGVILLDAGEVPMSEDPEAESVAEAVERIDGKTAADIHMSEAEGAPTIAEAVAGIVGQTADTLPMSAEDATTASEKMAQIERDAVKSVQTTGGRIYPDAQGNVQIGEVDYAHQLASDRNVESQGEYIVRTAAGDASISDGEATLVRIFGRQTHTGYVAEVLNLYTIPVERPVPAGLTCTLDAAVFEAYVEGEAGTYIMSYDGSAWDENPALYGVTVSGTPEEGDSITISWDGDTETEPTMTVSCPREADPAITAVLDRATFLAYVDASAIIDLYYTTGWSEDPAVYGITVTGTPIAGDHLRVVYVKLDRGLITTATPSGLTGTGWNLYNPSSGGKIPCLKYSTDYGYRIGGTYSTVEWSETETGVRQTLTVTDGLFDVPGDGWLFISDGGADTYCYMTWSDWVSSVPTYAAYTEDTIDLSGIMASFAGGLCRVGDVYDELDFNAKKAYSRIQRIAYSDAAMEAIIASGRAYDADTSYIYAVRESVVEFDITGSDFGYSVSDHGLEIVRGTSVAPYVVTLYGPNLKNKLEREVLTIGDPVDNLTSTATDKPLAANQGRVLKGITDVIEGEIVDLRRGLTYVEDGDTIAANANYTAGKFICWKGEIFRVKATINATVTSANWSTYLDKMDGIGGALSQINGDLATLNSNILKKTNYFETSVNANSSITLERNNTICLVYGVVAGETTGILDIYNYATDATRHIGPQTSLAFSATATTFTITNNNASGHPVALGVLC